MLQLIAIGEHVRQPGRERLDDGDVRDALLVRAQRQRLAHHFVDVDHRPRRLSLAGERQQVADDASGALRFAEDGFETATHGFIDGGFARQTLRPAQDRGQRVVELVGDA